ncbi:MAG TPA: hypothetical protein VM094_02670 [Gemmatimonadales bacterium]|nr:hypothetical protein [Gemmatimonadales bacterium]
MFSLSFQRPMPRLRRSVVPRLLALAVPLALGACDGGENPLAPAADPVAPGDSPLAPAAESVAPDYAVTATTAPRLAFASYRNGNQDIYKMDPQGYHVTRLTTASDYEMSPAWSWDNQRIALVRPRKDASNVTHSDIYLGAVRTDESIARSPGGRHRLPCPHPGRYPPLSEVWFNVNTADDLALTDGMWQPLESSPSSGGRTPERPR